MGGVGDGKHKKNTDTLMNNNNMCFSFHRTTTVDISVANVNNHLPQFNQSVYRFWLMESLPIGTIVGVVTATDGDSDVLVYDIETDFEGRFISKNYKGTSLPYGFCFTISFNLFIMLN